MIRPRKRVNTLASEAAGQFDAHILANRVNEQVSGDHDKDNDLLELVELAERSYDLSDARGGVTDGPVAKASFRAAETLNEQIETVKNEEIARACAVVSENADEWTDVHDPDDVADAVRSARTWLSENRDAAERAGVLEAIDA